MLNRKRPTPASQPAIPFPVEAGKAINDENDDEAVHSPSQVAGSDPTDSSSESGTQSAMSLDFPEGVPDLQQHPGQGGTATLTPAPQDANLCDVPMASIPENVVLSENPRPAKQPRTDPSSISMVTATGAVVSPLKVSLIAANDELPCVAEISESKYNHEDENTDLVFDQEALDDLENYDYEEIDDDEIIDSSGLDERLCRARVSEVEPTCSEEELRELDGIADQVEIARLKGMSVLQDPSMMDLSSAVHLTIKMVRTWRPKERGEPPVPVWYRRSRYVAREYAWLSERTDIFSPASTSLCNRLLPILFMRHKHNDNDATVNDADKLTMFALDICDGFLTVPQVRPTYVTYVHPDGDKELFYLGYVLPGQRSGSSDWYDDFTKYLRTNLDMIECQAHPSLVKCTSTESMFAMQMHVDDMLGFGKRKFVHETFIPTLKRKYKVTVQVIENIGDSITFLKRKHMLLSHDKLLLTPSPKHFDKLFDLLKIDENVAVKKTPFLSALDEVDTSCELSQAEASEYRSAIGLLLYLAVDLIECQCTIRALASRMAKPTQVSMLGLRHLGKYLLGVRYNGLMVVQNKPGEGLMGPRMDANDQTIILESFSDSNWAACKSSRRSVSASMIFVAGNMLFSSSRTQRVVALSSAEAELLSASSSMCDALLVRELLFFLDYGKVKIFHHVDATAAKAMLERSGVGKVRHLSCRILWTQQLIKQNEVALLKVSTTFNPADLGTKGLSRSRTRMLMCLVRVWDELSESFVGTDELAEERQKQSFKSSIKLLRQVRAPLMISKSAIRALMMSAVISTTSALSPQQFDGNSNALAMIADITTLYALVMITVLLLFTFAVLATIMCMHSRPTVVVQPSPPPSTASFDVHFKEKPSSSNEPIELRSRSSSKESSTSMRTSITGEEVMIKQRRRRVDGEVENPVWAAGEYGKKYHMLGCGKLNQSLEVSEMSENDAIAKQLKPCSFCNPRRVYHPEEFVVKKSAKKQF